VGPFWRGWRGIFYDEKKCGTGYLGAENFAANLLNSAAIPTKKNFPHPGTFFNRNKKKGGHYCARPDPSTTSDPNTIAPKLTGHLGAGGHLTARNIQIKHGNVKNNFIDIVYY